MTGSNKSSDNASPHESGDDSDDDIEILEESPCGRWSKRRQGVHQRDVPGIDASYLAMDAEEGMEVVWNEVRFSERRVLRESEETVKEVFECLTDLDHSNIVKLHGYWLDYDSSKKRIVFITEFMSSGSLRKLLKLTKRNDKKVHISSWKKWCIQILSALRYLHSLSPPIVHGNLTADTIFIQSNGLIKISSVAPDVIQNHVKTYKSEMKNMHYIAPEYTNGALKPSVDIYALGMCALEIAALEILPSNGESSGISDEQISRTIASLENDQLKDFILRCLTPDPTKRPGVKDLLLHPVLFEVPSLKLLAAHALVNGPNDQYKIEEILQHQYNREAIVAEVRTRTPSSNHSDSSPSTPVLRKYKLNDFTNTDKLEKFVEDVRYGVHPLYVFPGPESHDEKNVVPCSSPSSTHRRGNEANGGRENNLETDTRVTNMMCNLKPHEDGEQMHMTISLRLDNRMNRQLSCLVSPSDKAKGLTDELVMYGFISQVDHANVSALINEQLTAARNQDKPPPRPPNVRTHGYDVTGAVNANVTNYQGNGSMPVNNYQGNGSMPVNNYQGNGSVNVTNYQGNSSVNLPVTNYQGNGSVPVTNYQGNSSVNVPVTNYQGNGSVNVTNYQGNGSVNVTNYQGNGSVNVPATNYQGISNANVPITNYQGNSNVPITNYPGNGNPSPLHTNTYGPSNYSSVTTYTNVNLPTR